MDLRKSLVLLGVLLSGAAWAQEETAVPTATSSTPTMTAAQPVNPVSPNPSGPIIRSITAQVPPAPPGVTAEVIRPQFHFTAPNGNVVLLHMELVKTSANRLSLGSSEPINIPADAQKAGATVMSNWKCNVGQYYVTVGAYVMDSDGNHSNTVQYTIHCNGG